MLNTGSMTHFRKTVTEQFALLRARDPADCEFEAHMHIAARYFHTAHSLHQDF
jgi:hypothetical protein